MENRVNIAQIFPSQNPMYSGNPLIESLFEILSPLDFYQLIREKQPISRDEALKYDIIVRDQFLDAIKSNLIIPNRRLYDTYKLIHSSINKSYCQRNPVQKPIRENLQQDYRNLSHQFLENYESSSSNSSMIVGVSGIGKTTSINIAISLFRSGLKHINSGVEYFIQIPMVKIECPKDGSIKDLCAYFFIELDNILGREKYSKEYIKKRDTVNDRVIAMAKLVAAHCVGVLIVDEVQHLNKAKSGGAEQMLNFFLNLDNTLHIPIILVGTPETTDLFSQNHRLRRRFTSGAAFKWDLLPYDAEWELIVKQLFKYQYTEEEADPNVNWKELFYYHSQGIIDRAVKLFIEAQKYAFLINQKAITVDILEKAVKRSLWIDKDIFKDMAKGKIDYSTSEDLFLKEEETNRHENYRNINIKKSLREFNIPDEIANSKIEEYIHANPSASDDTIILNILKEYNSRPQSENIKSNPIVKKEINKYDLRNCEVIDEDQLHDQLRDLGVIGDLNKFIL
ncbi:MAG: ATP-binding protein [Candidatus Cyclobacteriaceae bacterium M2_1C_046]